MMPQVFEGRLEITDVTYAPVFLKILGEGVDEIPVDLSRRRCNTRLDPTRDCLGHAAYLYIGGQSCWTPSPATRPDE